MSAHLNINVIQKNNNLTARRYACAVYAVVVSVCPSVSLSVRHTPELYQNG